MKVVHKLMNNSLHTKLSHSLFVHGAKIISQSNVQTNIHEVFAKVCEPVMKFCKLFPQSKLYTCTHTHTHTPAAWI